MLIDGFRALWLGNPNMNSLVGIGSSASFLVGGAAALVPSLGFDASFLEEPVMLLAFVLLGRALEARAKVRVPAQSKEVFGSKRWRTMHCSLHATPSDSCFDQWLAFGQDSLDGLIILVRGQNLPRSICSSIVPAMHFLM